MKKKISENEVPRAKARGFLNEILERPIPHPHHLWCGFWPRKYKYAHLLKLIYEKLFFANDTPHKIALGLSLGVFAGIIPGTGPLAAIFLAFLFRANRAAALLGSLLTNTWLTVVTFLLSIKVGSAIMNMNWQDIYAESSLFLKNFQWQNLFKESVFKVALPLVLGYLVISLCLALIVYLAALITIKGVKYAHKSRTKFSQ